MTGMAEARAQKFSLMGQGSLVCGTWTAWRRDGLSLGPQQWVLGFLSGIGLMGEADVNPLTPMVCSAGLTAIVWPIRPRKWPEPRLRSSANTRVDPDLP